MQASKGRLDTHLSVVNTVFQSYVESGNDIRAKHRTLYDAVSHNDGLMGSTAVLVEGVRRRCASCRNFSMHENGVHETHEIQWKKG